MWYPLFSIHALGILQRRGFESPMIQKGTTSEFFNVVDQEGNER